MRIEAKPVHVTVKLAQTFRNGAKHKFNFFHFAGDNGVVIDTKNLKKTTPATNNLKKFCQY